MNYSEYSLQVLYKPLVSSKRNPYKILCYLRNKETEADYYRHLRMCGFGFPYNQPVASRDGMAGDPWHPFRLLKTTYNNWTDFIVDEWLVTEREDWCNHIIGLQSKHDAKPHVRDIEHVKELVVISGEDETAKQLSLFE